MGVAGFTRADLYDRRGPAFRWGLTRFLEPGDQVIEVHADHARIQRKDGHQQTFWNLAKLPPWLRRKEPSPA
jgi:hypothetical protein